MIYNSMISNTEQTIEENNNGKITDEQVLMYLWTVVGKFRSRGEGNAIECILCEEKLIHLGLIIHLRNQKIKLEFDLGVEASNFVQKVNRLAMQGIKDEQGGVNIKFISKAVDVVMLPRLETHFTDHQILAKLKILTFNNLGCILKRSKHYMMALRAVSFAVELQQSLERGIKQEQKYDIVPTYLNKAAILSQMGRHDRALEQIRKARGYVDKIQKEVQQRLRTCSDIDFLRRLQQKRHYGLYMKMLISYNMGVQKQHQKLLTSAVVHYQQGRKLAQAIDNQFMMHKLDSIVQALRLKHN